jgi:hypothetical protein
MKLRHIALALTLLLAFASDSWGQSKQQTPPAPAPSAQPNQTSKPYERGSEQLPVIVKILPTKENEEKAAADAHREDEKTANDARLARFTELLFWATGALCIIALFQLVVFSWQGYQLRETVKATKEAASVANKEFISTHRPRIVLHSIKFGSAEDMDDPVPIEFRYVNIGDTKGHVTEIGTRLIYTKKDMVESDLDFKVDKIIPPMEIESGAFGFRLTAEKNDFGLDAAMHVRADPVKLFCIAYIVYRDDMETIRQMGFCRQYNPETHRWIYVNDSEYEYSY